MLRATTECGLRVRTYEEDSDGDLFVIRDECGVCMIVAARNESEAWEVFLDETTPINDDELWEAYGFDSKEEGEAALAECARRQQDGDDPQWPDLTDGYHYQPNSTGTGIGNVGHHVQIDEMTARQIYETCGILVCRDEGLDEVTLGWCVYYSNSYSYGLPTFVGSENPRCHSVSLNSNVMFRTEAEALELVKAAKPRSGETYRVVRINGAGQPCWDTDNSVKGHVPEEN